jgi:hypothetical protein
MLKEMRMYYAGIGSRRTPAHVCAQLTEYAEGFAATRWTLRSGGADGADLAFEDGVPDDERSEIFVPWPTFGRAKRSYRVLRGATLDRCLLLASVVHPRWDRCTTADRLLHARDVAQIWGDDLNTPVTFVLFWAPELDGVVSGGTATAVEIARHAGIPTFNLAIAGTTERFDKYIDTLELVA